MKKRTKLLAIALSVAILLGMFVAVSAEAPAQKGICTWNLVSALKSSENLNAENGTSPFTVMQIKFDDPSADTGTFSAMSKSGADYESPDGIPGLAVEPGTLYVSPGCNTNTGICGAVAFGFTAPIAGTYVLNAQVTLRDGNTSTASDNLYDVTEPEWYTMKGQTGAKENMHHFHGAAGTVEIIEATYTLKAGETFYLVDDPNGNHWNDNAYISGSVTLMKADITGMAKPAVGSNLLGGNLIFKDAENPVDYNNSENNGILRFMGINTATSSLFMLGKLNNDINFGYSGNNIEISNLEGPLAYLGADFRAAALAFIVPADGNYTLGATFSRANTTEDAAFTPSLVYMLNRGEKLYNAEFWTSSTMNVKADLKAGDVLFIVSDPNGGENAWWEDKLYITDMSIVCNSLVKNNSDDENGSSDTGSMFMLAVLVCAGSAAIISVSEKKKGVCP